MFHRYTRVHSCALVCPVTSMGIPFCGPHVRCLLTVDEVFQYVTCCMNQVPEKWSIYPERGWHLGTLVFEWPPARYGCQR